MVIPTLRREAPLQRTLGSVLSRDPLPKEVVVVDGDPEGSAREVVEEAADRADIPVRYITSLPGLTRQRNRGAAEVTGEVILFLDDDIILLDDDFFSLIADAYGDDAIVGVTGKVIEAGTRRFGGKVSPVRRLLPGGGREGTFTRFGYPRRVQHEQVPMDVEFMQGCLMSARRSLVEELRFDEDLPGYGLAEDEDFSYRLSRKGRIRYEPSIVLRHENTGFTSHDQRAFGRLVATNRTYLFRKNFDRTPLARLQFGMLIFILVGHRLLNREWAGARGLVEGAADAWRARG